MKQQNKNATTSSNKNSPSWAQVLADGKCKGKNVKMTNSTPKKKKDAKVKRKGKTEKQPKASEIEKIDPSQPTPTNTNQPRRNNDNKLLLIGDEMLSGISERLKDPSTAYVNRSVDAKSLEVKLHEQMKTDHEHVLLQCGTNNIQEELRLSIPSLGNLINTALLSTDKPVLVNAIPGHLHNEAHNDKVVRINTFLKHRCSKSERLFYVNCNPRLERNNFKPDGWHFNEHGKDQFATNLETSLHLIRNFAGQTTKIRM